jgi:hypothetical protein
LDRALNHTKAWERIYNTQVIVDDDWQMEKRAMPQHADITGLKEIARRHGIRVCHLIRYRQFDKDFTQPSALRIVNLPPHPVQHFVAEPVRLVVSRFSGKKEFFRRANPRKNFLHQPDAIYAAAESLDVMAADVLLVVFTERCAQPRPCLILKRSGLYRVVKVGWDAQAFFPPEVFLGLMAFIAGLTFGM